MTTVRVLLEQEPSRLFLSFVEVSEPQRRRPSALLLRSHAVRFRSLSPSGSAWGYAGRLPFTRFRLFAFAPSLRPPLAGDSETSPASGTRRPPLFLRGSLPRLCISPRHTPTSSEYEKREAFPPPFGVLIPTLPIQRQRFRASRNPTLSPLQSPADMRNGRTECGHPRLERPRHRVEEPEFR